MKTWACLGQITPSKFDEICPLAILNQISTISMHTPSLVKLHWCLLQLSSGNEIWTDGRTYGWRITDGRMDRHTVVQRETIIPRHYRVEEYKNINFTVFCWDVTVKPETELLMSWTEYHHHALCLPLSIYVSLLVISSDSISCFALLQIYCPILVPTNPCSPFSTNRGRFTIKILNFCWSPSSLLNENRAPVCLFERYLPSVPLMPTDPSSCQSMEKKPSLVLKEKSKEGWDVINKSDEIACVPRERSACAFAVRLKTFWILGCLQSALRRFWSDCADAQADLSLRWALLQSIGKCCAPAQISE